MIPRNLSYGHPFWPPFELMSMWRLPQGHVDLTGIFRTRYDARELADPLACLALLVRLALSGLLESPNPLRGPL